MENNVNQIVQEISDYIGSHKQIRYMAFVAIMLLAMISCYRLGQNLAEIVYYYRMG